jgi:hypothetical protein
MIGDSVRFLHPPLDHLDLLFGGEATLEIHRGVEIAAEAEQPIDSASPESLQD